MPNYTLLRRGDRLPTVGVLQKLLNRSGAALKLDGIFGPRTRDAVIAFQNTRKLLRSGIVDEVTWSRLVASDQLPIVDCVDVLDPNMYFDRAVNVLKAGGQPVLLGGMSDGVRQAVLDIRSNSRNVFLLRFQGHGRSGVQGIAVGEGGWTEVQVTKGKKHTVVHSWGRAYSSISLNSPPSAGLGGLQGVFGPYGSVELRGCDLAAGAIGRQFVAMVAQQVGVPVSGGTADQYSTFRFDGPTYTGFQAFPQGESLQDWCEALPDFAPLSVP